MLRVRYFLFSVLLDVSLEHSGGLEFLLPEVEVLGWRPFLQHHFVVHVLVLNLKNNHVLVLNLKNNHVIVLNLKIIILTSVGHSDPHVFRPPASGSISQRYGSGSGSGSFPFLIKGLS